MAGRACAYGTCPGGGHFFGAARRPGCWRKKPRRWNVVWLRIWIRSALVNRPSIYTQPGSALAAGPGQVSSSRPAA